MNDEYYMRRALELSLKGNPSPNPYVGAVLVKDGKIISEGYHHRTGMAHAEVEVMRGVDCKGATLYVTLEPCSHWDRTPPCTEAIIAVGIKEVVYGADDPTEKVRGREELKKAGVKVRRGILAADSERINETFFKHARTGLPFVILKSGMTLDAQIATTTGDSKWITSKESRREAHMMRSRYDAILVGVNTVLKDDPRLTSRIPKGRDPLRIVLDGRLRIPLNAKVLKDRNVLVVTTEQHDPRKMKRLLKKANVWVMGKKQVDLKRLMRRLGAGGVTSVLIEGGSRVNYEFAKADLIDKYFLYIAPKLMLGKNMQVFNGDGIKKLDDARKLRITSVKRLGEDMLVEAYTI